MIKGVMLSPFWYMFLSKYFVNYSYKQVMPHLTKVGAGQGATVLTLKSMRAEELFVSSTITISVCPKSLEQKKGRNCHFQRKWRRSRGNAQKQAFGKHKEKWPYRQRRRYREKRSKSSRCGESGREGRWMRWGDVGAG